MADLTAVPTQIIAGDSYTLTLTHSDYPASLGWALALVILGGGGRIEATSTASGDAHVIALSATTTANLAAGAYRYTVRATKDDSAETIAFGGIDVQGDLSRLTSEEARSFAAKLKPIVEAALLGTLDGPGKMFMIAGRQVQTYSPDELLKLRAWCDASLTAESGGFGRAIVMTASGFTS